MGQHEFCYAVMPHKGIHANSYTVCLHLKYTHNYVGTLQESGVIQHAYNFNHPLKLFPSFFTGIVLYILAQVENEQKHN